MSQSLPKKILHYLLYITWIAALGYQLYLFISEYHQEQTITSFSHHSDHQILSENYLFVMAQDSSTTCLESITNNTQYCCPAPYQSEARKSKLTAFLLSFFLGIIGVDRFYLGFYLVSINFNNRIQLSISEIDGCY